MASPAEFEALSDSIGNGVLVLEVCAPMQFGILSLNLAFEELAGLRHAELSGMLIEYYLPKSELAFIAGRYQRCVDTRQRTDFVSELDLPERTFWWQTTLTPIFDARDTVMRYLPAPWTSTDRHNPEEELRPAAAKRQQSQNRLQ